MGRIEILWGILIVVFGLIGLVRGFLRELGVTTVLLIALFAFDQWGEAAIDYMLQWLGMAGVSFTDGSNDSVAKVALYVIILAVAAFVSYHGETLAFEGTLPKGAVGPVLALVIGLVNGYLLVGTVWFYLHKFGYPLGFVSGSLSPLAQGLVKILPLTVLSPFLPFLMVFMVVMRVIR